VLERTQGHVATVPETSRKSSSQAGGGRLTDIVIRKEEEKRNIMRRQSEEIAEAFVGALRDVMLEDLVEAEEGILSAIEEGDGERLVHACSDFYAAALGYVLIHDGQVFNIDFPVTGILWPELEQLACFLGESLHRSGEWADPELVSELVAAIFCCEEEGEEAAEKA
jgi:hypothetical protein